MRPTERVRYLPQLVTREDLRALLQAHPDQRDKALLAVLFESGIRSSEVCALNVGDVEFLERGGVRLNIPHLKGRQRSVVLWDCLPFLLDWSENHPHRNDPTKPLFPSRSRRARMARMTIGALHAFVDRAAKKAGIKKRLNAPLFRHSAAAERAREGWSEEAMREFFGWARNSDMPSRYVHRVGKGG